MVFALTGAVPAGTIAACPVLENKNEKGFFISYYSLNQNMKIIIYYNLIIF
jgi:hypothetical protein